MTRSHRRGAASLVLTLLTLFGLTTSTALAHAPDPFLSGGPFAQDKALPFRWRSGAEPPAAIKTAIRAAADAVTVSKASRAATFPYLATGANPIGYGAGATCGVNGIACFTRTVPTGFTMWLRAHGHAFDWGSLKWCQMYTAPPNGCFDAQTIALDEFGHVLGLGHHVNYSDQTDYLDAVVQTVSRTKPKVGWNEHVLGRCDVARLQMEYDMVNSAAKFSTCLDLATDLSLSASATGVVSGGSTTLTARLTVEDPAAYRRLGGNVVSNRAVTLQRRAVGASTWSSVGAMTFGSTSGTYVKVIRLTASAELRAVFSTPSTEGLDGSTSPVVRVSIVTTCSSGSGKAAAPCA